MKNYIKILFQLSILSVFMVGCYDDHEDGLPSYEQKGAVPAITGVSTPAIINSADISNSSIGFSFDIDSESVESVEVYKMRFYNGGSSSSDEVQETVISSFPAELNWTADEVAEGLGVSAEELLVGDVINFFFKVNLTDGTTVLTSSSVSFPVSCISEIPTEGTWTGTQQGDLGSTVNNSVTITSLGDGNYQLSDVSGAAYAPYPGFNRDQPVTIEDVCNSLAITGAAGSQVAIVNVEGSTYNPDTETLTVNWFDSTNGLGGTTVFTRN